MNIFRAIEKGHLVKCATATETFVWPSPAYLVLHDAFFEVNQNILEFRWRPAAVNSLLSSTNASLRSWVTSSIWCIVMDFPNLLWFFHRFFLCVFVSFFCFYGYLWIIKLWNITVKIQLPVTFSHELSQSCFVFL